MVGTVIVMPAAFSNINLNFGNFVVGLSTQQTVTFTNLYTNPLDMSSLAISGDYTQTNNCPNPLPANASCTITVTFSPSAIGARTGTITHANAITAQLTGVGTNESINPTRPTRPRPPGDSSFNNILSPMNVLGAVVGLLIVARITFLVF